MALGAKKTVDGILRDFSKKVKELQQAASGHGTKAEIAETKREELNRQIDSDRREQRRAELIAKRFEALLDTSEIDDEVETTVGN